MKKLSFIAISVALSFPVVMTQFAINRNRLMSGMLAVNNYVVRCAENKLSTA